MNMNDEFDGSFKIYVGDAPPPQEQRGNDPPAPSNFSQEVHNLKADIKNVENLNDKFQQYNEEIKTAETSQTMKDLRTRFSSDLDYLLKLAKQIDKRFDALVRANAALRTNNNDGDDQISRTSMISEVRDDLSQIMRKFQGLRSITEMEHRQLIEARYYAITGEKATSEAIDSLIANGDVTTDGPLQKAMNEHGKSQVLDAVAEIQERRDTMMEIRKNLMVLHQILLGIATPAAAEPPQTVDPNKAPTVVVNMPGAGKSGGGGGGGGGLSSSGLNDYERETRNQAYIAISIAFVLVVIITWCILYFEKYLDDIEQYDAADTSKTKG